MSGPKRELTGPLIKPWTVLAVVVGAAAVYLLVSYSLSELFADPPLVAVLVAILVVVLVARTVYRLADTLGE